MNVLTTDLSGVLIIEPKTFGDSRGFFFESYRQDRYRDAGINADFVQDNCSRSCRGTLRGLHYQLTKPQGKLVFVTQGEVMDVAVDLRRSSPSFGRSIAILLSEANHRQMYIPAGFAHGFCVTSDDERTLLWNDPELKLEWPEIEPEILSEKDRRGILLRDAEVYS